MFNNNNKEEKVSIKKEVHTLHVYSGDRDTVSYPNPNNYVINLLT